MAQTRPRVTTVGEATDRDRDEAEGRAELRGCALAAVGVAVAIFDARLPEPRIVDVTPAFERLTGYTASEATGQGVAILDGPETDPAARSELRRAIRAGRECTVTLVNYRRDGSTFWNEVHTAPLPGANGAVAHVVATMNDVSARRRTEAALREADTSRALFFANHPHPMWIFDVVTLRFLAVNEAAVHHYGYSEGEFLRMTLLDVRPAEDAAAIVAKAAQVAAAPGGLDVAGTWRHRRKDGSIVAMDVTTHAITFAGRAARLSVAIDVTERRQAEANVRASEERLQAILDNSLSVVYVKDRAGRYLVVNREFRRLFHVATEGVLGKTQEDIHAPDVAAVFRANDMQVLQSGDAIEVEERLPLPDGDHTYLSVKFPLRDASGIPYAVCGISTDITERKRIEERQHFLTEASEILAASLDYQTTLMRIAQLAVPSLADWCVVDTVDDDGAPRRLAVAHVDPAKVAYGWELHRRYPDDLDAPGGLGEVLRTGKSQLYPEIPDAMLVAGTRDAEHLRIAREIGMSSAMVVPLVTHEHVIGALSFVAAESHRHYGPDDLAFAEDLARRCALAMENARLYTEAQTAIRARDQFLSIAAHELRTPVAGIKGYAQMLLRAQDRTLLTPDRLTQGLRTINHASDRLVVLTNDLLDVSRIRLGKLPLRPRSFDLATLTRDLAARVHGELGATHALIVDVPDGPCPIVADPDRIEQVLTNLLENAIKYSVDGGTIGLRLRPTGEGVLLQVWDAGIGLPPGAAESIFEPFGRAPNATRRNLPGLGLGLYISRTIAERHGGRIWAESAGDDQGTTISLWLPNDDGR